MNKFGNSYASNVPYYQEKLELGFTAFLLKNGSSEKTRKNYLSDIRHFFRWLRSFKSVFISSLQPIATLLQALTPLDLEKYKADSIGSNSALATVNRRISSIRAFFSYCQSSGILRNNPASRLGIAQKIEAKPEQILSNFYVHLLRKGASKITTKNYVSDVRSFFTWLEANQSAP